MYVILLYRRARLVLTGSLRRSRKSFSSSSLRTSPTLSSDSLVSASVSRAVQR